MKKKICVACGQTNRKLSKEHFWPQWLIERTNTNATGVKWINGKYIPAGAATISLCEKCNNDFGRYLEAPVSKIFDDLENSRGISDLEAELLVRWLWKFEGLHWTIDKPFDSYTYIYSLRERVLLPIDQIRPALVLAVSMIDQLDLSYGDAPVGIDSFNEVNAVFVAGVFSRVAMMVLFRDFENYVPPNFSLYGLLPELDLTAHQKIFFPKTGFKDDTDAVTITKLSAIKLSQLHDTFAIAASKR
jgi:hypothetical protein